MASAPPKGSLGSNGRRGNPRMTDQVKQPGVQDLKAQELENEFKTKHIGVMGVLTWIL